MQYQEKEEVQKKHLAGNIPHSSFITVGNICSVCSLAGPWKVYFWVSRSFLTACPPKVRGSVRKTSATPEARHTSAADRVFVSSMCLELWFNHWIWGWKALVLWLEMKDPSMFKHLNVGYLYIMSLKTGRKATHFDIIVQLALKTKKTKTKLECKADSAALHNNILHNTAWIDLQKRGRQYANLMVSHRRKMEPVWMHILTLRRPLRIDCAFCEMTEYKVDDPEADDLVLLLRIRDVKDGGVGTQSLPVYAIMSGIHDW